MQLLRQCITWLRKSIIVTDAHESEQILKHFQVRLFNIIGNFLHIVVLTIPSYILTQLTWHGGIGARFKLMAPYQPAA